MKKEELRIVNLSLYSAIGFFIFIFLSVIVSESLIPLALIFLILSIISSIFVEMKFVKFLKKLTKNSPNYRVKSKAYFGFYRLYLFFKYRNFLQGKITEKEFAKLLF